MTRTRVVSDPIRPGTLALAAATLLALLAAGCGGVSHVSSY